LNIEQQLNSILWWKFERFLELQKTEIGFERKREIFDDDDDDDDLDQLSELPKTFVFV
jgi:hypothetical protein